MMTAWLAMSGARQLTSAPRVLGKREERIPFEAGEGATAEERGSILLSSSSG